MTTNSKQQREARSLRDAARMLENGQQEYPCWAVGLCSGGDKRSWQDSSTLAGRFILHMAPGKKRPALTIEASSAYIVADGMDAANAHSTTALCFAAAMAETGDLP